RRARLAEDRYLRLAFAAGQSKLRSHGAGLYSARRARSIFWLGEENSRQFSEFPCHTGAAPRESPPQAASGPPMARTENPEQATRRIDELIERSLARPTRQTTVRLLTKAERPVQASTFQL